MVILRFITLFIITGVFLAFVYQYSPKALNVIWWLMVISVPILIIWVTKLEVDRWKREKKG
ncbi:hypothetical protein JIR001_07350 [Polycladomyces abyssicola]|uniref:Uncharacterized protein n=1 Tax=Polycladomyces abyssicola TaxID=1125966 RepID=A0A8D5UCY5_9BACL|nr:hypothetical protein JIR001_07350 [Polycladomyces abyssicola]